MEMNSTITYHFCGFWLTFDMHVYVCDYLGEAIGGTRRAIEAG